MSRLERWSRRKRGDDTGTVDASNVDAVIDDTRDAESSDDIDAAHLDGEADNVAGGAGEPPTPGSLDATLPDPESLAPGSDIKAFLEPGVSRGLRRRALRRLFAGEKYGIRDGLDDYDHDYREKLKPLASELAQRMRKWTAPAEETEEELRANEGSNGEAHSSPDQPERPAEQDETPSSEDSMAAEESRQLDDDPMLDQGRVGNRRQSGQD